MNALTRVLACACALLTFATAGAGAARPPARRPARATPPPRPARARTPPRPRPTVAAKAAPRPAPPRRAPARPTPILAPVPAPAAAIATAPDVDPETLARRIVELTNAERAAVGVAPLAWDEGLAAAAEAHAEDLAARGVVEHVVDGVTPRDRVEAAGEAAASVGENLFRAIPVAADPTLAEGVVAAWMGSPGHRENVLDPAFTAMGVGVSLDPIPAVPEARDFFAVQVFARPAR